MLVYTCYSLFLYNSKNFYKNLTILAIWRCQKQSRWLPLHAFYLSTVVSSSGSSLISILSAAMTEARACPVSCARSVLDPPHHLDLLISYSVTTMLSVLSVNSLRFTRFDTRGFFGKPLLAYIESHLYIIHSIRPSVTLCILETNDSEDVGLWIKKFFVLGRKLLILLYAS